MGEKSQILLSGGKVHDAKLHIIGGDRFFYHNTDFSYCEIALHDVSSRIFLGCRFYKCHFVNYGEVDALDDCLLQLCTEVTRPAKRNNR